MSHTLSDPLRVLLVEDNPDEVYLARMALGRTGVALEIELARDGREAVASLLHGGHAPDLVLLDLNLPLMNGVEVLRAIRPTLPLGALRVVIYTTSASLEDRRLCLEAGCDEYHVKPMGFDETVALLKSLLAGKLD